MALPPIDPRIRPWLAPGALALLGAILLASGIQRYKARLGYGMEARDVLVAVRPLPEGRLLRDADLAARLVPAKLVPLATLLAEDLPRVRGRALRRPAAAGTLLTWSDLDVEVGPPVPARRIPPGYRAIAVPVSDVTSAGHALRPDDLVDLVATLTIPGEESPTTLTLLQNVAILAVGEGDGERQSAYTTVTLMVLPKEAGLVAHALQEGRLTFLLRNPEDPSTPRDLPAVGTARLVEAAFRNSIQDERNQSVEIIRGGGVSAGNPP